MKKGTIIAILLAFSVVFPTVSGCFGAKNFKIDGKYRIIYQADSVSAKECAQDLAKDLKTFWGVSLAVKSDRELPFEEANGKEILVGYTDRYLSDEAYADDYGENDWRILIKDKQVAFVADNSGAFYGARQSFCKEFGADKGTLPVSRLLSGTETFVESADIHELSPGVKYSAVCEKLFSFNPTDLAFCIPQGSHFDGTYFYVAMNNQSGEEERSKIYVLDKNGTVVRESGELSLRHANSMTYHAKTGTFLFAHCQGGEEQDYYGYSVVDAETLTVTGSGHKEYPFFALAYDGETDRYASGEWGGQALDVWDGNFSHVLHKDVETPASLSQGAFCDKEGIYFCRSPQNGANGEIRVYDWSGTLLRSIDLPLGIEVEDITVLDGVTYLTFNNHGGDADGICGVYKVAEYEVLAR